MVPKPLFKKLLKPKKLQHFQNNTTHMSNVLTTSTLKNIDKTNVKWTFFISHSLCHPKLSQVVSKFSHECPNVAQDAPKVDQVAPKSSQDGPKTAPTSHMMRHLPPKWVSKNIHKTNVKSTFSLRSGYVTQSWAK